MTKVTEYYDIAVVSESLLEVEEFYCGTEYEIEDIKAIKLPGKGEMYPSELSLDDSNAYWVGKLGLVRDGSLRNNGIEFITKPVTFDESLKLFETLHAGLILGPNPYTVRTSTHVHVNMCNMTLDQIKHFLLLYALLEPVFFEFAGPVRKHNIHCVPLSFTILPNLYSKPFPELVKIWTKYSAFNLAPLRTQGTVEFRHLYGTGDIKVYQQWLTMIKQLWNFAYYEPPTSLYNMIVSEMSPKQICNVVMPCAFTDNVDFSTSLIDVKLAF
jgi:Putative amidoligase enzyme